ncbi:MAG: hypothetical protein ACKVU1_16525 [bacterium]
MNAPVQFATIDAGSNAIRLLIARAESPLRVRVLETERVPVRLGHNVFTDGAFDRATIAAAAKAFCHFRALMNRYHVTKYRAVATSATREAKNRAALLRRIQRESGIRLTVIGGNDEARLVRAAVRASLGEDLAPRLIVDLGGGSLELNLMRGGDVERSVTLPVGTVRLMETFDVSGKIDAAMRAALERRIVAKIGRNLSRAGDLSRAVVVACGGNAEALAQIAPGRRPHGIPSLSLRVLTNRLPQILSNDVRGRMRLFDVRRDRAEVMGIAAIIFTTLGRMLSLRELLVPGVGVREGVLDDLVSGHFALPAIGPDDARSRLLLEKARAFGRRLHCDMKHAEHVRSLALSLFDQLRPLHGMGRDERVVLSLGALLHDAGHFVNHRDHHKHGEYLVRHGEIDGINGWRRDMLACLVRYHYKAEPVPDHKVYGGLDTERQHQVRGLTAILRLASALDVDMGRAVRRVDVAFVRGEVVIRVTPAKAERRSIDEAARRASLFEEEFGVVVRVESAAAH